MQTTKIKLDGTEQEKAKQLVDLAKKRIVKCDDVDGLVYSKNFIIEYAKCVRNVCSQTRKLGTICANIINKNIQSLTNSISDVELTPQERIAYMQIIDNANKQIFRICVGGYVFLATALLSLVYLVIKLLTKNNK